MDVEEFDRRGAERRANRNARPTDRLAVAIGAAISGLVILWIVWGVTA